MELKPRFIHQNTTARPQYKRLQAGSFLTTNIRVIRVIRFQKPVSATLRTNFGGKNHEFTIKKCENIAKKLEFINFVL